MLKCPAGGKMFCCWKKMFCGWKNALRGEKCSASEEMVPRVEKGYFVGGKNGPAGNYREGILELFFNILCILLWKEKVYGDQKGSVRGSERKCTGIKKGVYVHTGIRKEVICTSIKKEVVCTAIRTHIHCSTLGISRHRRSFFNLESNNSISLTKTLYAVLYTNMSTILKLRRFLSVHGGEMQRRYHCWCYRGTSILYVSEDRIEG